MKLSAVFDAFSRRGKEADAFTSEIPAALRNKILLYCHDVFSNSGAPGGQNCLGEFWSEIHRMLQYRHGKVQLIEDRYAQSKAEDAIEFLLNCGDDEFLDFVEYIFRVDCMFHISPDENAIASDVNELFVSDGVGYELTQMVKERVVEPVESYPFFGREVETIRVVSYPRVIRKDARIVHTLAVKPTLLLLAEKKFRTANEEFLHALEDFRKGDYGDCLTKCGSAFESVMKIICAEKNWQYRQTDTASRLVRTIIENTDLDSYFEQPLIIIATIRNRLSTSHGAGTTPKCASEHIARYALNATASAILLLVDETD